MQITRKTSYLCEVVCEKNLRLDIQFARLTKVNTTRLALIESSVFTGKPIRSLKLATYMQLSSKMAGISYVRASKRKEYEQKILAYLNVMYFNLLQNAVLDIQQSFVFQEDNIDSQIAR